MKLSLALTAVLGLTAVSDAAVVTHRSPFTRALHRRQNGNNGNQGNNQGGDQGGDAAAGDGSTTLSDTAIQTGSQSDGQADADAGQSPSAT